MMEKHVKKIGEIDLPNLLNNCRDQGWLEPIDEHDDSPKSFEEVENESRPDLNFLRWNHDTSPKVFLDDSVPKFIQEISKKYDTWLFRVMCLAPETTLDYHVDFNKRVNIPLITNDSCFYIFDDTLYKLPADGSVFLTDTKVKHTAINCSKDEYRFHLIGYTNVN